MKWSDRIAQGFDPGWGKEKRALKVAPDVWAWLADRRVNNPNTHFGRHFQGALCGITPRAEALAILSDHFIVRIRHTKNARRGKFDSILTPVKNQH